MRERCLYGTMKANVTYRWRMFTECLVYAGTVLSPVRMLTHQFLLQLCKVNIGTPASYSS